MQSTAQTVVTTCTVCDIAKGVTYECLRARASCQHPTAQWRNVGVGGTHLVSAAVIEVMVGSNASYNLDASFLSSSLDLGNVVRIDGRRLVRRVVDEEVRVVVVADGDRHDLHFSDG